MINKIAVIINIGSGYYKRQEKVNLISQAFKNLDIEAELFLVHKASSVTDAVKKALSKNHNTIIAAGGDGTLNAVASVLLGLDVTLGILPMGTFNHLARDLGIPSNISDAAKVIANGKAGTIDVGMVNGKPFFNNSSIGLYSKLVHYRDEEQKIGWSKRLAVIKAMLTSIGKYSFLNVEMEINDSQKLIKTPLVFIGNNKYNLEGMNIGSRENITSGLLSVYIIKHAGKINLVSLILWAILGKLRDHDKFDEYSTRSVVLKTRKRFLRVALDGEIISMASPLHYEIKPKALKIIIP